jgi:hypothetical protein
MTVPTFVALCGMALAIVLQTVAITILLRSVRNVSRAWVSHTANRERHLDPL